MSGAPTGYRDLRQHIATLDSAGLLVKISEPVNKDTEMYPLVRWQFRGGIPEKDRKAFLFTNVTGSGNRTYDIPVLIGALATNPAIYSIGMNVPIEKINQRWEQGISHPITPKHIINPPCQEVVITSDMLDGEGNGLDMIPVPISTPGYDCAPYLTATNVVTCDPETGIYNMGTYRAGFKSSRRLGMMIFSPARNGGFLDWEKYREKNKAMPVAVVLGTPPVIAYLGPQKIPHGVDEFAVAGGIAGCPINVAKCKTNDLIVPAEAEIIIEGFVETEYLEPEGPFGESHGYVALEDYNLALNVTCITHRKNPILSSIISQVTPSESSVIKRVAMEPLFLAHLRTTLGIKGIIKVSLHEPLTNLRPVVFIQFDRGIPNSEIWRGLYGLSAFQPICGKYIIAVNEDIDPDNGDAIFWALAYRSNPALDVQILPHRDKGHGPKSDNRMGREDATMLIDATLKGDMPPIALPKKEYMEKARVLWEKLDLPPLKPESPWHGYSLGDWNEEWEAMAERAANGDYMENGRRSAQYRRSDVSPNTSVRDLSGGPFGNNIK